MANSLYLEWFPKANGRVVIEPADYQLQIFEPAWRFTKKKSPKMRRRGERGQPAFSIAVNSADGSQTVGQI